MSGGLSAAEALLERFAGDGDAALAVSGGADSLALMVLMRAAVARVGADPASVMVYSVDHGLRPEAADEVAYVVSEARRLGFSARGLRWEGDKPQTGVQAAARSARYGLMAAAMRSDGKTELLTAHHLADQAETVLMRLAHGSGIDGLKGMQAVSLVEGCRVHRPLLGVDPEMLREVVRTAGLEPAEDPSNADRHYERVRWRQLQPELEAMGLSLERIGVFAGRMGDAAALVSELADVAYTRLVCPLENGGIALDREAVVALNPLVRTALLSAVLGAVSAGGRAAPLTPLEALGARLAGQEPFVASTLNGCAIAVRGKDIVIRREGPRRASVKPGQGNATA